MKVILLQRIPNLGEAGDVVEVKDGFGRNFLIPRGLAQHLSKKAVNEIEEIKRVALRRSERELDFANDIAKKLKDHTIQIKGRTGARGNKLYGSITTQQIANAILERLGVEIDKRKISLPEQIKTLGLHDYTVKLHTDVTVESKVEVVKI
ncbi:MAG TPA: 50S ribosomal protein L9 [Firmicutes bacterium]|nr:50S ribosomal protein L9 [Bacillota bacterium]